MNYDALMADYRMQHDPGDAWGSSMGAMFDLCAELWVREDGLIPDEWCYSPGAMSGDPRQEDSYLFDVFVDAETADLERIGGVLFRYTRKLIAAGRDY